MIKVLSLNIWNYEGPWQQRLGLIRNWIELLQPDLIGMQEVLLGEQYDQAAEIFSGMDYHLDYAGPMAYWNDTSLQFGNLVASRWPISDAEHVLLPMEGKTDQRVLIATTIDSPYGQLSFNTTHLSAQPNHGYIRELQVSKIGEVIMRRRQSGAFPPILCGDFNATPDSTEIRYIKGLHSLNKGSLFFNDAWQICHPEESGHTFTRANAYHRDHLFYDSRLDYLFVGRPLGKLGIVQHCDLACHLPLDDVFPSDHFGLYAELTTAS